MKKVLSMVLTLAILMSTIGTGTVLGASYLADIYTDTALFEDGQSYTTTLTLDLTDKQVSSFEVKLDTTEYIQVNSVTFNGITLDASHTYAYNGSDMFGVLSEASDGVTFAYSKLNAGTMPTNVSISVEYQAINDGPVHIVASELSVNTFTLIDNTGSEIKHTVDDIEPPTAVHVLTTTIYNKLNETISLIEAIPADAQAVTLANQSHIEAARTAYDALVIMADTDLSVITDLLDTARLTNSEATIEDLLADVQAVADLIEALPSVDEVTLNDKAAVQYAREELSQLSTLQYNEVSPVLISKLEALELKIAQIESNINALNSAIALANSKLGQHPVGSAAGNVAQSTYDALVDAKNAAVAMRANSAVLTASELSAAIDDLNTAIGLFEELIITDLQEQKAILARSIVSAEVIVGQVDDGSKVIGQAAGQYPQESYNELLDALANAKAVQNNSQATVDMLTSATILLDQAVDDFIDSEITALMVANRDLDNLIESAETTFNNAVIGSSAGQYPESAKSAFLDAIDEARTADRTQLADVNGKISGLNQAISDFEGKVITDSDVVEVAVNALFTTEVQDILKSTVTQNAITNLQNSINALPVSQQKTNIQNTLDKAQDIFDTPISVSVYASGNGISDLEKDHTMDLSAKVYNALNIELTGLDITWTSLNTSILTVNSTGSQSATVLAIDKGQTVINAQVVGTTLIDSVSVNVYVIPDLIVSSIPNGKYFKDSVSIFAYRNDQTITVKEGQSQIASDFGFVEAIVSGEGNHIIDISSTGGGNDSAQLNFNIDMTVPVITMPDIQSVENASVVIDTLPTFTDAHINNDTKKVYVEVFDGTSYVFYKSIAINDKVSEPGQYRLTASVSDLAGNRTTAYKTFEIVYDMSVPEITVSGFADVNSTDVTLDIQLSGGSNSSNYYFTGSLVCSDGTTRTENLNGLTLTSSGEYTLEIGAYNPNNPSVSSTESVTFIIDKHDPTITITNPLPSSIHSQSVTPVVEVADVDGILSQTELKEGTVFELRKNGVLIPFIYGNTIHSEGAYNLTAKVTDIAGKTDTATVNFTIDKTSPTITVDGVANGDIYYEAVTATITTDADATVTVLDKDGQVIALNISGQTTFQPVANNTVSYKMVITAIDAAGNETQKILSFAIDDLPVTFKITGITEGANVKQLPSNIVCTVEDGDEVHLLTPEITKAGGGSFDGSDGDYFLTVSYEKNGTQTKGLGFTIDSGSPRIENTEILRNTSEEIGEFVATSGDIITVKADVYDDVSGVQSVFFEVGDLSGSVPMYTTDGVTYIGHYNVGSGNYTGKAIKIQATDQTANVKTLNVTSVTIDNQAPTVSATITPNALPNGENDYYLNANTKVTLTSDDPTGMILYRINGGGYASYNQALGFAPESNNLVEYYVQDAVGNMSQIKSISLKIDAVSPSAPSVDLLPLKTANKNITIEGNVSGANGDGTMVHLVKGGNIIETAVVSATGDYNFANVRLSEGLNTYTLLAQDLAGNMSVSSNVSITLDSTAPVIEVNKVDDLTYTVTTSEPVVDVSATFNGVGINPASISLNGDIYTITTPAPQEGSNQFIFVGKDDMGNVGSGSMSSNYMPPNVAQEAVPITDNTVVDIPEGAFGQTTILTVQSVEVETQTQYQSVGSPIQYNFTTDPIEPIIVTSFVGAGLQGIGIIHISDAGEMDSFIRAIYDTPIDYENLEEDQPYYDPVAGILVIRTMDFSTYQYALDNTDPVISITTTDFNISKGEPTSIAGTITDDDPDVVIVAVTVNGQTISVSKSSPFNIMLTLEEGINTVKVKAEDAAGNYSTTTKTYTVDRVAPSINASAQSAVTDQASGTILVNTSEPVELKINGSSVGTVNGEDAINVDLDVGNNSFTLIAKDALGNTSSDTVSIKRVQSMEFTVNNASSSSTNQSSATITGSVNVEAQITINDALKGSNVSGNFSYSVSLVEGDNTFTIAAEDSQGNRKSKTIVITYVKDNDSGSNGNDNGNNGGNEDDDKNDKFSTSGGSAYTPGAVTEVIPKNEVKKLVSTLGGVIDFLGTNVSMTFEHNTVGSNAQITVKELEVSNGKFVVNENVEVKADLSNQYTALKLAGKVYEFTSTESINKSVEVTISFEPSDFTEDELRNLGVYMLNETTGEWDYVPGTVDYGLGTVTVTLPHFSVYALMTYSRTFSDINGHWAQGYIEDLASMRVINGKTDTTYAPNDQVTRAEFAKLLVEILDIDVDPSTKSPFSDVTGDEWYGDVVIAAYNAGVISGKPDGSFGPLEQISREQVAVMVMNAYTYAMKVDYKEIYTGNGYLFNDSSSVSSWAASAVEGAKVLGIINGKGNNVFDPKANASRAEAAKMLRVFFDVVQ